MRRTHLAGLAVGALSLGALSAPVGAVDVGAAGALVPQAVSVPRTAEYFPGQAGPETACVLPDGTPVNRFHCYTPQQIRSAYGVDAVAPLSSGPNYGQGQTIVLVDSYGSPSAPADLAAFHDKF